MIQINLYKKATLFVFGFEDVGIIWKKNNNIELTHII
jgi:hypothetical protein